MTSQPQRGRAALFGHGRRSIGLGARDPRERRDAQARQQDVILAQDGGLTMTGEGKLQVDAAALDAELQRRGFVKNGGA